MPQRPERQYRSFAASNFTPVGNVTADEQGGEPSYKVRGYFTTFSQEYELYPRTSDWPAEYEQISPDAFDGCDMTDVIMQYDHEGPVMARIRNASLAIGFDSHGGWCEADLSGCQQARDLYEAIANGLVAEMSFGFTIADDDDGRGTTFTRDEQGDFHWTITRIARLYDVSAVSIPANPNTEIEEVRKRSYAASILEAERRAAQEEADRLAEQERAAEKAHLEEQAAHRARRARALSLLEI